MHSPLMGLVMTLALFASPVLAVAMLVHAGIQSLHAYMFNQTFGTLVDLAVRAQTRPAVPMPPVNRAQRRARRQRRR